MAQHCPRLLVSKRICGNLAQITQIGGEMDFYTTEPSLENYWRSVILFGRNVASYKFALSKALIDLSEGDGELITLDQLADPFATHVCEHLKHSDKQATSSSSRFLDECRKFNSGEITKSSLNNATLKLGFTNVIDAFHIVNQGEIPQRFFVDERRSNNGIRLTDNFHYLFKEQQPDALYNETEARWRLVESAWSMNLSSNLITIHHDAESERLVTNKLHRRVDITSCRDALNGYQKGRCFYSFKKISIRSGGADLADVDHFFPHALKPVGIIPNLDGVWNLVLSSRECNRGEGGKFARLPSLGLLERLHKRNEYLITSHHPLRETLIKQTGKDERARRSFLQNCYHQAKSILIHSWEPDPLDDPTF
jgi:hypothetical protein